SFPRLSYNDSLGIFIYLCITIINERMGAHQQIYVGPYIKVKKAMVPITHNDRKCLTSGCVSKGRNSKNDFCPNCGNKTTIVPRIQMDKVSPICKLEFDDIEVHEVFYS